MSAAFAFPPDPECAVLVERLWADDASTAAIEAGDRRIAELLGLDLARWVEGEALRRCERPDCGAFFWAEDGAVIRADDGALWHRCPRHADPLAAFAEIGERLHDAWDARNQAADRWPTLNANGA